MPGWFNQFSPTVQVLMILIGFVALLVVIGVIIVISDRARDNVSKDTTQVPDRTTTER